MNRHLLLCLGVLQYAASSCAHAQDKSALQIHGFASQGYLLSDGNNFYGESPEESINLANINSRQFAYIKKLISNANEKQAIIHIIIITY